MDLLEIAKDSVKLFKEDYWTNNEGDKIPAINDNIYRMFLNFFVNNFNYDLVSKPDIGLCDDRSVDFCLRKNGYRFLANIGFNGISWYGDDGKNKDRISGVRDFALREIYLRAWIKRNFSG